MRRDSQSHYLAIRPRYHRHARTHAKAPNRSMSALGQKRTLRSVTFMSASDPKRTCCLAFRNVLWAKAQKSYFNLEELVSSWKPALSCS